MKGETEQGKSSAVKVALNRSKIKDHVKTSILINADGESLPLEISADEKLERRIEADPATLALGEQEKSTLTLRSYYGFIAVFSCCDTGGTSRYHYGEKPIHE